MSDQASHGCQPLKETRSNRAFFQEHVFRISHYERHDWAFLAVFVLTSTLAVATIVLVGIAAVAG